MSDLKTQVRGLLILSRPANLPTAVADIWAGVAIAAGLNSSHSLSPAAVVLLSLASIFIYAAGVVLNDVFDASIDAVERPERPIPRGMVSRQTGFVFGIGLVLTGIVLAFTQGQLAGLLSLFLVFCVFIYDGWAKHLPFVGPLFMGMCRALNLLIGISVMGQFSGWAYALLPLAYIFAVTQISKGEVYGKNKTSILLAAVVYAFVLYGVLYLNPVNGDGWVLQWVVLALFAGMNYYAVFRAYRQNTAANIKRAVIAGVLGIVVLDAALAAPYAPWWYTALILALLPLSMGMSRYFKVT